MADYANDVIKHHASTYTKKNPLFLYLPFQDVHSPLQVPDKYLALYPNITNKARKTLSGLLLLKMYFRIFIIHYFLAKVSALDDAVGKIISSLKLNGLYKNSIILFTADVSCF